MPRVKPLASQPSTQSRQASTQRTSSAKRTAPQRPTWPKATELIGLSFELEAIAPDTLPANYTTGLHAWFLNQIRACDPSLSAYLHDGESEKPFTISNLEGPLKAQGHNLQLQVEAPYRWSVTALSAKTVQGLSQWLRSRPADIDLRTARLNIRQIEVMQSATTYAHLWNQDIPPAPSVTLSFLTPTSFRRKGHHLPLPWPRNVFHSYLRRWNDFSGYPVEDSFLEWVDECVIIQRHHLASAKVAAGKRGAVTGFTGSIQFSLSRKAQENPEFVKLFHILGQFAPYCGTGHKTPFGLGVTRSGWMRSQDVPELDPLQTLLAQRISELTEVFLSQRKRQGGQRSQAVAEKQATILARRELGESLRDIAKDLDLTYETVKTYVKFARRSLREGGTGRP